MFPNRGELREGLKSNFRPIDIVFADFVCELGATDDINFWFGIALASYKTGEGYSCLPLAHYSNSTLFADEQSPGFNTPPLDQWRAVFHTNCVVASPGGVAPLILDENDCLYLRRYWEYEESLSFKIKNLLQRESIVDTEKLQAGLIRLFSKDATSGGEIDWQCLSAATSVLKPFSVISGGPGTGKTSTVTKILALLIEQTFPAVPRIALAAPTGKAAMRLGEAVKLAKSVLPIDPSILRGIPDGASTLHRLLGAIPGRAGFRYNADHPLNLDVLVVDESSMIDLPLMSKLLDALETTCRLILLGDKGQLASVEPGNVFGDICNSANAACFSGEMQRWLSSITGVNWDQHESQSQSMIADSITVLDKSYRFSDASGIGHLSKAVNLGDAELCQDLLENPSYQDISWTVIENNELPVCFVQSAVESYRSFLQQHDPLKALETFGRFRVLCAVRKGPFGVLQINQRIEDALGRAELIAANDPWYQGRPLMVTRNDYRLNLFNGDIGVVLADPESGGDKRAFFLSPEGNLKKHLIDRLPDHETAFAMTIHKSQGSEFDRVFCVLPDESTSLLSRELIYTAITRAKERVELWGQWAVFQSAISRVGQRYSGLGAKLR